MPGSILLALPLWYIVDLDKQSCRSGEFFSRCVQPQNIGSCSLARKDFSQACIWEAETKFLRAESLLFIGDGSGC